MGKMTVAEAAQHFNVSKEAIHNRIRRGSVDCVIENGIKYVVTGESTSEAKIEESRYYEYIEQENERLKAKVEKLEGETSRLRDQREQMLIDERDKIEQIYKERDEQLRSVLNVVATKFLANMNVEGMIEEALPVEVIESEDEEVAEIEDPAEEMLPLKAFLKLKLIKEKEREKIKKRFRKALKNGDARIFEVDAKLYVKPRLFDYSDLL